MTVLEVTSRIGFEEQLMLEYFGNHYREYMKRTGRLLPRITVVTTFLTPSGRTGAVATSAKPKSD
jgi:hypothetical protein